MTLLAKYRRVTKANKCPLCQHDSWCLVARDGSAVICTRTPNAQPWGESGFFHKTGNGAVYVPPHRETTPPAIDATKIMDRYQQATTGNELFGLSQSLGVNERALLDIGLARAIDYSEGTFAFPMRNEHGGCVGIRLRNADGAKWAVWGSKEGLFYDPEMPRTGTVLICEGPTDTAAMMSLGFDTIGRPSCSGAISMTVALIKQTRPDVVIVSDADGPGREGSEKLADALVAVAKSVKIIEPLVGKDAREWKKLNATGASVRTCIDNAPIWKGK